MPGLSLPYLLEAALMVVVLLFSVIVHEVAHGYVALLNGDPTAKMLGRLSLNPGPHIDPMGTIFIPLMIFLPFFLGLAPYPRFVIGWAKPVPVNPLNYRNYRRGEITVSAAGVVSNLALAVVFAFLLRLGLGLGWGNLGFMKLAYFGVHINIILAVFNLVPIPPLDGSHILAILLPRDLARVYAYLEPVGFVLILVLLFTGILWAIIMPFYQGLAGLLLG